MLPTVLAEMSLFPDDINKEEHEGARWKGWWSEAHQWPVEDLGLQPVTS